MPLTTQIQTRKAQRRLKRHPKRKRPIDETHDDGGRHSSTTTKNPTDRISNGRDQPKSKKQRKDSKITTTITKNDDSTKNSVTKKTEESNGTKRRKRTVRQGDPYDHLKNPEVIESLRRDDEEIATLRSKLGLGKGKDSNKKKLNKEYAKLEGYGDDFGDFLDDLDDMVRRVSNDGDDGREESDDEDEGSLPDDDDDEIEDDFNDRHRVAPDSMMDRDDAEILELERKLAIGNKKDKAKLHKEYKLEGYGDDFGDFLDGLDDMIQRVSNSKSSSSSKYYDKRSTDESLGSGDDDNGDDAFDDDESEVSEELVPMKDPDYDDELDEDDSVLEELEREEDEVENVDDDDDDDDIEGDEEEKEEFDEDKVGGEVPWDDDSALATESEDDDEEEPDHDISDTYRPSKGEDIYGNKLDAGGDQETKALTYVPPHLRNKVGNTDSVADEEKIRLIRRGLNNALNRLSDDTLVSVAQQLAQLYKHHPTQMVHELLWKNTKDACILVPILMKGMIPAYLACIIGVHIQSNDTVQVGEYLLEAVVTELWSELDAFRGRGSNDDADQGLPSEIVSKHICNRMLILCYLYNFGIVHCSFMYSVIRHLIEKFTEVDIECLLLLLSHCGRSLRSDDPLALKEIVLLVQKKNSEIRDQETSSRAEYMVTAITDLKNNRRGKQDTAYGEKTNKLRKILGQIKSAAAKGNTAKSTSEATLRISLEDILNAETKGRWWKVGASWVGNQYRFAGDSQNDGNESADDESPSKPTSGQKSEEDEALLKLASKLRMNTDRKRAIFCIIMGSEDCEDAFEKLCRGSMLQNKSERDVCRVLLECCLNEKPYNRFYGHLAARICEYQPQCKFSLQLAFWDMFKQFDTLDGRKAANLAKFLFHLTVTNEILRFMTVIKAMDISEDDMEPSAQIFLTILLTTILSHFHDTGPVKAMFALRQSSEQEDHDESRQEQEEGARASLLIFFMEILKASPKNVKGSHFRKNFKAAVKALDTDGFESML